MKSATKQAKSKISLLSALTEKKTMLLVSMLLGSSAITILNSLYMASLMVGVISSIVFFVSLGVVCGMVFYDEDPSMLKAVKGWFTPFLLLSIAGSLLLYFGAFSVLASALVVAFVTGLFFVLLLLKLSSVSLVTKAIAKKVQHSKFGIVEITLSGVSAAIIAVSFYVLLGSRTSEPMLDVWYTVPNTVFASLIFVSALILIFLILLRKNSPLYFPLLVFQYFLLVSIYYIVWYPSLYGDPLQQLGIARYAAKTGNIYARDFLFSNNLWIDIVKYKGYSSLVVQFSRLLSFDIYWVHNVLVPFCWAVVLPFLAYEVTCILVDKPLRTYPREGLLAAFSGIFLVRWLISWGANPTPNSLAFLFLFFTITLAVRWVATGGKRLFGLTILGVTATFMTHPLPGIFAAIFLFIAIVFHNVKWMLPKILLIAGSTLFYPLICGYQGGMEFQNLFALQNLIELEETLVTVSLLFAAVGFLFSLRQKSVRKNVSSLMFTFYVLSVVDYYITKFTVASPMFGAGRILAISEFLLVPYIALCFNLLPKVSAESSNLQRALAFKVSNAKSAISFKIILSVVLCFLISVQSVITLYQAYPENEVDLAPTAYEVDAILYMNSTARRRFVVLSDTLFTNLAIGLLGQDYSYIGTESGGAFGVSSWDYEIQKFYLDMVGSVRGRLWDLSFNTLEGALYFAYARIVYFVVSERLSDFEDVVMKTSEILQVEKVFGSGKLYIFKYPTAAAEGLGPKLTVFYDGGAVVDEVQSVFSYMVPSDVKYSVQLFGHTDYNISNYPINWIFKNLTVNKVSTDFDNSSDINSFIFIKGLKPSDILEVIWSANDNYPTGGWKEDSFKTGWGPYPGYKYKIEPTIDSDGNIITLSWNFTEGEIQDYYYAKTVKISTNDYPFAIIRWKSSAGIAISAVYFDLGVQEIVKLGSYSAAWTTTIVELPSGKNVRYVMIGISNIADRTISGLQTLSVDYVLLCASA